MNTNSLVIKTTIAVLTKLNYYFEYSFVYKVFAAIGSAAKNSSILKSFLSTDYTDYWQGSFILRPIAFVVSLIVLGFGRLFNNIVKANKNSLNRKLFHIAVTPLSTLEGFITASALWLCGIFLTMAPFRAGTLLLPAFSVLAVLFVLCGVYLPKFLAIAFRNCVPVRLVKWFFDGRDAALFDKDYAAPRIFRFIHLLLGIAFGLTLVFLPLRLAVILTVGFGLVIFTFFNLKLSYMLFFLGMLIIPDPLWNNMLILLSAIFYAGVYTIKWFMTKPMKISFKHISPALIMFIFFCCLSIFTGFGGMDSLRVFIILLACIIHSILIINIVKSIKDLRLFFLILAVAVLLTSLFGLYQFTMGIEIRSEFTDLTRSQGLARLYSTLGNPNNDAESWSMLLPFVLAMIITTKSDIKRVLLTGAFFICVAAFALTYSRMGYVALMAGMGVFVLVSSPRLVPIALIVLLLSIPFLPQSVIDRLLTIGQDTSSIYRLRIWEGTFRMLENYWVQGIGMGPSAFISIYRGYAHPSAWNAMHAHNMFLNILAHSGIGALLAFLAYLLRLFKYSISSYIAVFDRELKIYLAAGLASLTAFVVFGMSEYVWFYPRVMLVFWLMSGLILAMVHINDSGEVIVNESTASNIRR
ncbi:MAG: O-antigen ligase family protein [Defluviitaleaceae bacterium]|nr:O-antigen ligase family protein [Defluviitaleaceae bacterium]